MTPDENSGVFSLAMLDAALEPLHAEIAAARADVRGLKRQVQQLEHEVQPLRTDLPRDIAQHLVALLQANDLMSSEDRRLNTVQAAAFLGVEETWLRINKHKIGYRKGKSRSSPLSFGLGDLKAYNARGYRPPLRESAHAPLPPPLYLAKPSPSRQRPAAKRARTAGPGTS
jgi:hypothetical protein